MSLEAQATFWEHFEELRLTLKKILITVLLSSLAAFFFYETAFTLFTEPLKNLELDSAYKKPLARQTLKRERLFNRGPGAIPYSAAESEAVYLRSSSAVLDLGSGDYLIPEGEFLDVDLPQSAQKLIVLSPTEGMLTTFKISLLLGVVGSSPFWMFLFFKFLSPGLKHQEKGLVIAFFTLSVVFLFLGGVAAYYVMIPFANQFLYSFNAHIGENYWSLSYYLNYTLLLYLATGIAFEFFVLLLFLVHFGILTEELMRSSRRYFAVVAFVLGAVLTPPDVLTQCILAFTLLLFYELALLYAKLRARIQGSESQEIAIF